MKTTAQPFSFSPSQFWEGNDGIWSTFVIRVGTPAQTFRVLISTLGQETWVPVPEGCGGMDSTECGNMRGVQAFDNMPSSGFMVNKSSTWESIGLYELALEDSLNYTGNGMYGFDTVGLELQNSGGLTLNHQIVAGIATMDFMFGVFGLGPKPTNFTDFNDPRPSYMWSLKNQSLIPSLSFGYSAGAPYRDKGVFGSLIIGGYDAARFEPNNMTFTFGPDSSQSLLVGVQSIQSYNTLNGSVSLLPRGIFSMIDSTVPEIWLPLEACRLFEASFGLVYDPQTDRYLVNDTVHSRLQNLGPILTFQLGNDAFDGESIIISLPYSAFDLQADYPIYPNITNYFPLRRAPNESQYTIGRTFLQESYIIVDYERQNFSISQSLFPNDTTSNIIAISPISSSGVTKPFSGLGRAELIGIVVFCVVIAILLLGYGASKLHIRRQKQRKLKTTKVVTETEAQEVSASQGQTVSEVYGSNKFSHQLDSSFVTEMDAGMVQEIGGDEIKAELPAIVKVRPD